MNSLEYRLLKAIHYEGMNNTEWWIGESGWNNNTKTMFDTTEKFPLKDNTPYLAMWVSDFPLSDKLASIITERKEYVFTEELENGTHFYLFELHYQHK